MAVEVMSAEVRQVQTSSLPGSEPKAMATWSGTAFATTWVFQTRPVASSVEWRAPWAGWIKTESIRLAGSVANGLCVSLAALTPECALVNFHETEC